MYAHTVGSVRYHFRELGTLLAKATPARSGDALAGLAAESAEERVAAQMALADLPLATFLTEAVVPCEARAYAVARRFEPLLVNTVVGFIGPEYLYDGKQILRAGLEDHFCGKLMGLPMGCDVCYTNHAEADQDDMDALLTVLGVAGCTYIMGVPGADDVMLGYQSTSFHDALYLREALGLRPSPEFESWLQAMGVMDDRNRLLPPEGRVLQLAEAVTFTP